jgi:kynurenine formamidase
MANVFEQLQNATVYDLGQPYFTGMPHFPTHPPFLFGLTKKHGDIVLEGGVSASADAIALGTHVGTHIDALCHFSCGGKVYGGIDAESNQTHTEGMKVLSVDSVAPILRRGVLLDIAGNRGLNKLLPDFAITPKHLDEAVERQGVAIQKGDVVLLRTGWGAMWHDPVRYITGGRGSQATGPGPEREGAEWLSSRGIFAAGSDTVAFERVPSGMAVHVHLLVESGIHIIEALNLEELAAEHVYEFLFIAIPLKIRGATGSPIRPVAIATGSGA